jgi:toxin FitB
MIVLDTNVISELLRQQPDGRVVRWLDRQPRSSVWTTAISVYESRSGILSMPPGRRKALLLAAFEYVLNEKIQGRIAVFDLAAAVSAAELESAARAKGRPIDTRDAMIAGTVLANGATLATRNVRHFEDIAKFVVNPWE